MLQQRSSLHIIHTCILNKLHQFNTKANYINGRNQIRSILFIPPQHHSHIGPLCPWTPRFERGATCKRNGTFTCLHCLRLIFCVYSTCCSLHFRHPSFPFLYQDDLLLCCGPWSIYLCNTNFQLEIMLWETNRTAARRVISQPLFLLLASV